MRPWLGLVLLATLLAGCSERSSMFIENASSQPVVVRVFFHDFGESFGFSVPAGVRAWAWAPLEGRVSGPIAVYDEACHVLWHDEIRSDGGLLALSPTGGVSLVAPPGQPSEPPPTAFLEFTDACAESANPRTLP
jgi:hypothetical protein